jgi:uncharacterized protein (TIGR02268 family)
MEVIPMVGRAVVALSLLLAGTALAQTPPARVRREQSVTLNVDPSAPVPEIHTAPEVTTVVLFDAEIRPDTLEVDRARVKILGIGPRFILLQPVVELGSDERVFLRVLYVDGRELAQAVLVLVTAPLEVDTRIEVVRPTRSTSACQVEVAAANARCAALSPTRLVREGWLGEHGVSARLLSCEEAPLDAEVSCINGMAFSADRWTLLRVEIEARKKGTRTRPWRPRGAILRDARTHAQWQAHAVEAEPAELTPGQGGRVFVEFAAPLDTTREYTLELSDVEGHSTTFPVKKP